MESNCSECDDAQNSSNPVSQTTSGSSVGKVSSTERLNHRLSFYVIKVERHIMLPAMTGDDSFT